MGGAEWRLIFRQEGGGHYSLIYVGPREGVYGSKTMKLEPWRTAKVEGLAIELVDSWANINTYVARIGDKVVGALKEWEGIVDKVYVDPAYRRQGIATALWEASGATRAGDELSPSGAAWASAMMGKEIYSTWGSEGEWAGWLESLQKAASTWRGFSEGDPFWVQHDAVIATQRRGRDRYYEVWVEGKNFVNRPTLEQAKEAVEQRLGPLDWKQISMPKVNVIHYYFGRTDEFTDPLTIYVADR
jgi:GNAT superfamily N-acetyltransferase